MQTASIVQASAEVITITKLRKNDVYKRLVETTYSSEKYQMLFGVVQDVIHNGTDGAVTALEFEQTWNQTEPKLRTFSAGADLKIFAATPEEVEAHFNDLITACKRERDNARNQLDARQRTLDQVVRITDGVTGRLTAPEAVAGEITAG